jgi:hypothetical protein
MIRMRQRKKEKWERRREEREERGREDVGSAK